VNFPHTHRRGFLAGAAATGLSWLTPLGTCLARASEKGKGPAKSVIVLWLGGGPSQLETFDPKPGTDIAAGSKAIGTSAKGVQLAAGLEQLADQMAHVSLVRSLWSKEGDHERGTYTLKTGFRPDPTVTHPSLGAIVCHDLPATGVDIPRHVSILPTEWPARGGLLGRQGSRHHAARLQRPLRAAARRPQGGGRRIRTGAGQAGDRDRARRHHGARQADDVF